MQIELYTKHLVLRPLGRADLATTHAYTSDRENIKYMVFLPHETVEETQEFLCRAESEWGKAQPQFFEFAIMYEGLHIGGISVEFADGRKSAELGWILKREYQNRGFVTEAARSVLHFAAHSLGITHVIAHCDTENAASCRVMEKLGMRKTAEYGGRKNKCSQEERREYCYELYQSLLETTANTRELGGYRTCKGGFTKMHALWRSDFPKCPSGQDISFLQECKITMILDLRDQEAIAEQPNIFAHTDGFSYVNCPIEEGSKVPESEAAVPVSYLQIAEAKEIANVFRYIANAQTGVLFHCSAGKDRSGVVAALLLLHAGVSDEEIIWDYLLTKECNAKRLAAFCERCPDQAHIVTPCESYMREFLRLFREKYQDTGQYLRALGLTGGEIMALEEKLS